MLALLALPLLGLGLGRRILPRSTDALATLGFSGATGAVLIAVEMFAFSLAGVRWSPALLCVLPAMLLLAGRSGTNDARRLPSPERILPLDAVLVLAAFGAVVYATFTSRATGGDFLLFWATKGEHFAISRSIDDGFLRDPFHRFMHPSYPPLVPLLYAWASLAARRLSWEGALWTLPLFLGLGGCVFLGYSASQYGRRQAATLTAVLLAMLGLVTIAVPVAGNAEPALLFFETVSLSALLFGPREGAHELAAGIGLAGAAMTKLEGSVFAALVVGAHWIFGRDRNVKSFLRLAAPPVVFVAAWLLYCRAHGLRGAPDLPTREAVGLLPVVLREMARQASFGVGYVPWIAVLAVAIGRKASSESRTASAVALGFVAAMIFIYLGPPSDPTLWILWSAPRLFMTPLLCAFFAAAAAIPGESDLVTLQRGSATTIA